MEIVFHGLEAEELLTHGSLFAGIGGFDLGFERAGIKTIWQVEIDPYCQRVLAKHFPSAVRHGDIRTCGSHNLRPIDMLTGGFPCQPTACSGKRQGAADSRWLWPEMFRVIQALRPIWVVAENPLGIMAPKFKAILDEIYASLERAGYDKPLPLVVPASAFGAPHERYRLFIVAYLDGKRCDWRGKFQNETESWGAFHNFERLAENMANSESERTGELSIRQSQSQQAKADAYGDDESDANGNSSHAQGFKQGSIDAKKRQKPAERPLGLRDRGRWNAWATEPRLARLVYGVPNRVDRIRGLGNAVVPQIAEWIGRRIVEACR